MTVSALTTRNDITATASQTSFTYTFRVLAATDMTVYQNGVLLASGYTVNDVGVVAGGTVTLSVGATAGQIVSLVLAMPLDRTTDYQNSGDFLASDVNADFDKMYIGGIQNENSGDRSLRLQDVEPTVAMTLPVKADRVGKFLYFNATTGVPETSDGSASLSSALSLGNTTGGTDILVSGTDKILFGSPSDFEIYQDGLNSHLYAKGGGGLFIRGAVDMDSTLQVDGAVTAAGGTFTGSGTSSSTYGLRVYNSTPTEQFSVRDDGRITMDGASIVHITKGLGLYVDGNIAARGLIWNDIGDVELSGDTKISSGVLKMGSTTVMDSSRNLINIASLTIPASSTPASASATGTTGMIQWDSSYIYTCVATNTWKRAALSTW